MARRRREPVQLALPLRTRGGRRAGAGRKRLAPEVMMPHRARPEHKARHPVLVTMRTVDDETERRKRGQRPARLRVFRERRIWQRVATAIDVSHRDNFRIVHYSVQADHIHLLVEADDTRALSNGLRALCIRITRRTNPLLKRTGRLFGDRWHGRTLESPRQVRNALGYVLNNYRKHASASIGRFLKGNALHAQGFGHAYAGQDMVPSKRQRDPCSSAPFFSGFSDDPTARPSDGSFDASRPPRTWLLRVGWRRAPPLRSTTTPGGLDVPL